MLSLFPLLAIPFGIMLGFKVLGGKRFTLLEFFTLEGGMLLLLTLGFGIARCGAMSDTEVWSGRISKKTHGSQHCCHCREVCQTCSRTDSKGNTETYRCNCREECDHFRDYWWAVDVTTGDSISIRSCEPNKNRVPAAWTNAFVGEPAAVEHRYTNYLKADPESVFMQSGTLVEGTGFQTPKYPAVHSFYKIERAINLGTNMNKSLWNNELMDLNADLGAKKQVNVVVIATISSDPTFAYHIEKEWLYGKKNDLIFVLGAPNKNTVEWASVVTISRVEMLRVKARDELVGVSLQDPTNGIATIRKLVSSDFERTPMAEFEYLSSAAKPPGWALFILYMLGIVGSIGGSLYMLENDFYNQEKYYDFGVIKFPRNRRW